MTRASAPQIAPAPLVMRTAAWEDYGLIDSGGGRKLERYGPYRVVRPEAQCLWAPALSPDDWDAADAVFEASDEEDAGRWRFARPLPETWPMAWRGSNFPAVSPPFATWRCFPSRRPTGTGWRHGSPPQDPASRY